MVSFAVFFHFNTLITIQNGIWNLTQLLTVLVDVENKSSDRDYSAINGLQINNAFSKLSFVFFFFHFSLFGNVPQPFLQLMMGAFSQFVSLHIETEGDIIWICHFKSMWSVELCGLQNLFMKGFEYNVKSPKLNTNSACACSVYRLHLAIVNLYSILILQAEARGEGI